MAALLIFLTAGLSQAQWIENNPVTAFRQQPDGVQFTMKSGVLRVKVCTDSILHIVYSPAAALPSRTDYVITKTTWPAAKFTVQDGEKGVTISTSRMRVEVNKSDGFLAYSDASGKSLVTQGPNSLTPVTVNGEKTYHAESHIKLWDSREAFYGLGQHQAGVELPRRIRGYRSGQHQHLRPDAALVQWLWHLLEQQFA